jgi:DNA primase
MAGRIPKSFIDDLIARSDVVEVVGRRLPLKRAGREYKACCPFHNEKSPSFYVNPQKGFYHCFGCGANGSALNFIMEYDHCDFVTAVEVLASEMGLTVPREHLSDLQLLKEREQKTEQLQGFSLLVQAATWFSRNLREHATRMQAVAYLKGRGVTGAIARDFGVGFSPNDADALQRAFPQVTTDQWLAVGLVSCREDGSIVDRFRGRIQFPIRDTKGRVVGFGGRIMQPSEYAPKYLNSPETTFFHKGQMLYGLYELLQSLRHIDQVLVVEGYMDVVALAQYDIRNVVATLGTATGEAHLQLLFKYTKDVVFAFDGDKAGRQAAWKALPLALQQLSGDRGVKFFFLPEGEDPDSFVRRVGKAAFLQALSGALSVGQWLTQGLAMQTGMSWRHQDEARRLLIQAGALIVLTPDLSVQYGLIQALAQVADMQEWQVEKLLSIRTGLAVNRRAEFKKKNVDADGFLSAQSLPRRLLLLLASYPQLTADWPNHDLPLLKQFGASGVMVLLNAMLSGDAVSDDAPILLTFEQAQAEWCAGWQQLVCQTIQNARQSLLKISEGDPMNDEQRAQLRLLSDRLRECRKRE